MAEHSRWFISDRAIERSDQDAFGHVDVANQLADIVDTVQAPATIGLIGGFGTGKSSIGNLLAARLASHRRLQVVTLSGERHTGIARQRALVYSFAEALQEDAGVRRTEIERVLGRIEAGEDVEQPDLAILPLASFVSEHRRTLLRAAGWALLLFAVAYLAGVVVALIANAVRENDVNVVTAPVEAGYLAVPLVVALGALLLKILAPWIAASFTPARRTQRRPRAEAADELERVFGDLAALCPKRLVIVVDDVDRLPPEEVLEALATIKSLQAVPKKHPPIFVIACDDEVVRRAIQTADPGLSAVDGSRQKAAEEYLNKLFLVRQPLPPALREDMTGFAEKLLTASGTNHAGPAALGDSVTRVLEVLIHDGVTDPRHVVRLLNAFFADYRLATVREGRTGRLASGSVTGAPLTLARLTVLRIDFPYAYAAVREEYGLLPALDSRVLGDTLDASQKDLIERADLMIAARAARRDESPDDARAEEGGVHSHDAAMDDLPPDLAGFLRRTARYVEQDMPLGPFFYLSQTHAGRILGSRRAEEIRAALENNDVETVRSRLADEETIGSAAVDHIIATLRASRPGLPLANATATAASCLGDVPVGRRQELAATIAEIISREPGASPAPPSLADLVRYAPEIYRPGLVGRLVAFDAEDAASPGAIATAQLAIELPSENRLLEALARYFTGLPHHSGYAGAREWVTRAAAVDPVDRNRIYGPEFYAAIIASTVGARDDTIPAEEADHFADLLRAAPEVVRSSATVLDAVRGGLTAQGRESRWFAMRTLELLTVPTAGIADVLMRVSEVCSSKDIAPYDQTLTSAMKIITSAARDQQPAVSGLSSDVAVQLVAGATAAARRDDDAGVLTEAAQALQSLGPLWPSLLQPAVEALAAGLESHRSTDDDTGRAIQMALLSLLEALPPDSGDEAAEALLSPIATATDQHEAAVRMAIEAALGACQSEQGRALVSTRVPAWRQVFQGSITIPAQVRPQAEALRIAAKHGVFAPAEQQALLGRLGTLAAQGHPVVEVAAETLAAIPWASDLQGPAAEVLAGAWDALDEDTRRRVVHDLTLWPADALTPSALLVDAVAQFVIDSSDEPREELLSSFWAWFSSRNRAAALAAGVISDQFRRTKLRNADAEECFETLLAATRTGNFPLIVSDLSAVDNSSSSAAATRFIQASLTDEGLGWDDDHVHAACGLVSSDDAGETARTALSELGEGATRAARGASLIAWLRMRRADGLNHLDNDLTSAILDHLPLANEDLAGRLGYASKPIAKRQFNDALKALRADKENQRARSAADAFESGRQISG